MKKAAASAKKDPRDVMLGVIFIITVLILIFSYVMYVR